MKGGEPIFVIGAARSGTTLVARILGQHSAILAPGETHFMEEIWACRQHLGDLRSEGEIEKAAQRLRTAYGRHSFHKGQQWVDEGVDQMALVHQVAAAGGGYANLYRVFCRMLAAHQGKRYVCDDTPKHVFHIEAICALFPEARFVACVRDPRDYLASYKYYWRRSLAPQRVRRLYHPISTSLLWRGACNALIQEDVQTGSDSFILVRYESLVRNARQEVCQLAAFLDLPFETQMLVPSFENSSYGQQPTTIHAASIGRWREELSPAEVWWLTRLVTKVAGKLGYELESPRFITWPTIRVLLSLPVAAIRALWVNREHRGPLATYLRHRLRAILR